PTQVESEAVLTAINILWEKGAEAGIQAIEDFISANPASAWTPSLRANIAYYYRLNGRYSLALKHWSACWSATKDFETGGGKAIADFAFAHWTRLLASLGRIETLLPLLKETKNRVLDRGPLQNIVNSTREGVST